MVTEVLQKHGQDESMAIVMIKLLSIYSTHRKCYTCLSFMRGFGLYALSSGTILLGCDEGKLVG